MKTPNLFLENDEVTQTSLSDLISDKINDQINHFILKHIESRFLAENAFTSGENKEERKQKKECEKKNVWTSSIDYEEAKKDALNYVKLRVLNEIYKKSLVTLVDDQQKLTNLVNKVDLPNLIKISQFAKLLEMKEKKLEEQAERDKSSEIEVVMCSHFRSKHYSDGLCRKCFGKEEKKRPVIECQHVNEPIYAKQLCKKCYQQNYHKSKKRASEEKQVNYDSLIDNFMNDEFGDVDFF